jgi:hypothetical protein
LSFSLRRSSASAVFFETLIVVVSFKMDSPKKHMAIQVYKYTHMQQPTFSNNIRPSYSHQLQMRKGTSAKKETCYTSFNGAEGRVWACDRSKAYERLFKNISEVAKNEKEVCVLIDDAGFEHVCDFDTRKIFRKRKY